LASTSFALSGLWVRPWPEFLCGTNDFGLVQLIDYLIESIEPWRFGAKVNWIVSGSGDNLAMFCLHNKQNTTNVWAL